MKALPYVGDKRVIDMHVHVGPEFLCRSVRGLAAKACRFAVVMKNHFIPTIAQVSQGRCPAGIGTAGHDIRNAFCRSGRRQIFAQIADLTGKNA